MPYRFQPILATVALGLMMSVAPGCAGLSRSGPASVSPQPAIASPSPTSTAMTAPLHPFARHDLSYATGSILPNLVAPSQLDASVKTFYDAWKAKYLTQGCGSDRYYVNVGLDGNGGGGRDPNSISISEGHGYGMLITAFMAGYDPQARTYFDGLFKFFKDHPSSNAPHLMAWDQVTGCGNSATAGTGSATDGDADIAYALILADRQWGSGGAINYLQEAKNVLGNILAKEVNPRTSLTMLGDWVDPATPTQFYGTRSSDFFINHFKVFAAVTGDPSWTKVVDATYGLIGKVQSGYSPATGLLPDFIQGTDAAPQPATANYLESADDGHYSYNACRDPWRIGMDALLSGDTRASAALGKMNTWIRSKTQEQPANMAEGYDLAGNPLAAGSTAAFVAPFGVSAMVGSSNQAWLNASWSWLVNRRMADEDYYGNTLKLVSMIVMSGNWWSPASAP